LIFRKVSKIGVTRCQILRLKCTKFNFRWGSAPDPAVGAYRLLAVFNGPTSKEREGEGGGEGKREGKGRGGEGRGREGRVGPQLGSLDPPVYIVIMCLLQKFMRSAVRKAREPEHLLISKICCNILKSTEDSTTTNRLQQLLILVTSDNVSPSVLCQPIQKLARRSHQGTTLLRSHYKIRARQKLRHFYSLHAMFLT